MPKSPSIQFLQNHEIDKLKWDECINSCTYGLIYARSFYLDNIAPGWSAIADDNYEWVLPVIHRKKLGIKYLYQPPFTQQTGIFAKPYALIPFSEIIYLLQEKYSFWEVSWNKITADVITSSSIEKSESTNYILDLHRSYDSFASKYHNDLIKNLKRSRNFKLFYRVSNDASKYINLYRQYYGSRINHVTESDYENFLKVCLFAQQQDMLVLRKVVNEAGDIMAAALLLKDNNRLYNLMNTTTDEGRKSEANHFLIDAVIREHAGQELILDFEGSDLPGVKSFYKNFGAVYQPYFSIKYNNLPWPLKLLKN